MIKLIIFDLDGVLIDSKHIHFAALNKALKLVDEKYVLSYEEHIGKYDGLTTFKKLSLLTSEKGLPIDKHDEVWKVKQEETTNLIKSFVSDQRLIKILEKLSYNFELACCTNSIKSKIGRAHV